MQLQILIEEDEGGWFIAECPALPGCVSQGKTLEEAIENIKDAINGWLYVEEQKTIEEAKTDPRTRLIPVTI